MDGAEGEAGRTGRRQCQHRQGENPATLQEPQVQAGSGGAEAGLVGLASWQQETNPRSPS